MNKAEMESIRMSMIGQDQHLAEALECCRQIRMEAERMEKAYSAARENIRGILSMEQPGEKERKMTTEDLEKAAADVINGKRGLTWEERDQLVYEQLKRKDEEEEKLRQEMMGRTIHFPKDDTPLTAEEREEKHRMIPTRIATKTGTWEIIGDYRGDETIVRFTAKNEHEDAGPHNITAYRIVLTVKEWFSLNDEMERAMTLMVL